MKWLLPLMLLSAPLSAQSIWPDHDWWTNGSLTENHVSAHLMGGAAVDILARGPWISRGWRNAPWKRVAWAGVIGGTWEYFQLEEIPCYTVKSAVWDEVFTISGAAVLELGFAGIRKLLK